LADNIAGRLEARGPRVLNLGMSGDGPLTHLATLTEYAVAVRPEVVLWIFFEGNDLDELEGERRSPTLMRYLQDDFNQDLIHRQAEIDRALSDYVQEQERTREMESKGFLGDVVFPIAKLRNLRVLLAMPTLPAFVAEPPPPLFGDILGVAQRRVQESGGRLYFVYLPRWGRYAYAAEDDGSVGRRDDVLAIVRGLGIPMIDIHEVIRRHPDPVSLWPFGVDGHYTPEGYELVAEAIGRSLDRVDLRNPSTR
jgi:hypothetical protein